jgi:hypothetical protein
MVNPAGCSRDVRLAGKNIRSVTVKPVTLYGVSLDENATPKDVVYVLLRAIREDFEAQTPEAREAALDKQFDICAANAIEARNRGSFDRDEFVHNVVYRWTPTVAHYVGDFETERSKASARLIRRVSKATAGDGARFEETEVLMEVNDPSGDPSARVVMVVWLAKDKGMWRVVHLGFDPHTRSISDLITKQQGGG